jgi:hypothetical protein
MQRNNPHEIVSGCRQGCCVYRKSCFLRDDGTCGSKKYDIGVAFTDLADQDKALLRMFVDYLAKTEADRNGEKPATRSGK